MDIKWNNNGNWVVTASRDHLLKLFDIRNLSSEVQTFRGHKKESSSVAWHPYHEGLFCSGGSDGAILFWHVGYVNKAQFRSLKACYCYWKIFSNFLSHKNIYRDIRF